VAPHHRHRRASSIAGRNRECSVHNNTSLSYHHRRRLRHPRPGNERSHAPIYSSPRHSLLSQTAARAVTANPFSIDNGNARLVPGTATATVNPILQISPDRPRAFTATSGKSFASTRVTTPASRTSRPALTRRIHQYRWRCPAVRISSPGRRLSTPRCNQYVLERPTCALSTSASPTFTVTVRPLRHSPAFTISGVGERGT